MWCRPQTRPPCFVGTGASSQDMVVTGCCSTTRRTLGKAADPTNTVPAIDLEMIVSLRVHLATAPFDFGSVSALNQGTLEQSNLSLLLGTGIQTLVAAVDPEGTWELAAKQTSSQLAPKNSRRTRSEPITHWPESFVEVQVSSREVPAHCQRAGIQVGCTGESRRNNLTSTSSLPQGGAVQDLESVWALISPVGESENIWVSSQLPYRCRTLPKRTISSHPHPGTEWWAAQPQRSECWENSSLDSEQNVARGHGSSWPNQVTSLGGLLVSHQGHLACRFP